MDPQFDMAALTSLFPYSSSDSVDEQNRCVAFELPKHSGSIVLRNEELSWMVEHYISVTAWKQFHRTHPLYMDDPFNINTSGPSLALKLDLY